MEICYGFVNCRLHTGPTSALHPECCAVRTYVMGRALSTLIHVFLVLNVKCELHLGGTSGSSRKVSV
jgi:hypothetical protein